MFSTIHDHGVENKLGPQTTEPFLNPQSFRIIEKRPQTPRVRISQLTASISYNKTITMAAIIINKTNGAVSLHGGKDVKNYCLLLNYAAE